MGNIAAIFVKEMRSYFGSPIAYVMAGVFLLFTGYIFQNLVLDFHGLCQYYQQDYQQTGTRPTLNVNDMVVAHLFRVQVFVWMMVTPMLTMRLYAEEKRSGTLELLMTSPLTTWQTLLGKFAACLTLYLAIEVGVLSLLGFLSLHATLDWGPILSAYLGILLVGATFISVGIMASSITENQIVAVVMSFFLLMLLWLIDWSSRFASPTMAGILRHLSILAHMSDLTRGVIDTHDVVFFLSMTVFFLFLTHTVIESRRWRQ